MSASSHGFVVVRRGYRPEQVDQKIADLGEEREAAAAREAELVRLSGELEAEAERLWGVVAALPPQDYAALGEGAQQLLELAATEASGVRDAAESDAQRMTNEAEAAARELREQARAEADRVRAAAESDAVARLEAAGAEADVLRRTAQEEAEETRGRAVRTLQDMARRCSALLSEQEQEHAAESEALDRELAEQESALEERVAELEARGDQLLQEAKRAHAEAEENARHCEEDARARAEELLAAARVQEEGVERETERVLQQHTEEAEEMRRHMAHIRSSLATLTGSAEPEEKGA